MIITRSAVAADLSSINAIYNHYVEHSTCTYQLTPDSPEVREQWFRDHGPRHPILVHEDEHGVDAWAALSPFRAREAYRRTVESSVYVRHDRHRRGLGRGLMLALIERARSLDHHVIIAGISAEQEPSLTLHRELGFQTAAHLREVGFKFDRWLDVMYLQLIL